jgi:hypothetical protein
MSAMRRKLLIAACALAALAPAPRSGNGPGPSGVNGPTSGRWRGQALGVCWEGSPRPVDDAALDPLAALGVNAISQTPFAFMKDPRAPALGFDDPLAEPDGGHGGWWGERADGVHTVAAAARARGIATLLKPHVWLHGSWPGEVEMDSETAWQAWFAQYREFLLAWARFAAETELEGLCIGTELDRTLVREREWRALVAEVRAIYPGLLTYAANWTHFEEVPFWDALDAIGVNAYFPLTAAPLPETSELVAAWQPIRARLATLAERIERPVVFTEIGYHPAEGALAEPWLWDVGDAAHAPENQARAYEAALTVFLDEPWFGGIFWWKWHAERRRPRRGSPAGTFSPQGLPAEAVLERVYTSRRPG